MMLPGIQTCKFFEVPIQDRHGQIYGITTIFTTATTRPKRKHLPFRLLLLKHALFQINILCSASILVTYKMENANFDITSPWINASRGSTDTKVLGWMVESMEIDPFDSNHWLYGTGLTIYGGHDLTSFPAVTVQSLADGVEETSVQDLISIPGGTPLLSAIGDVGGFVHKSLDVSPSVAFINPSYPTVKSIDFAGQHVANIVRVGNDGSANVGQLATSTGTFNHDYYSFNLLTYVHRRWEHVDFRTREFEQFLRRQGSL
jgi:hypothetical protein